MDQAYMGQYSGFFFSSSKTPAKEKAGNLSYSNYSNDIRNLGTEGTGWELMRPMENLPIQVYEIGSIK